MKQLPVQPQRALLPPLSGSTLTLSTKNELVLNVLPTGEQTGE